MAEAMKGVTKAMGRMNKNMKLPQIQKIMQGFDFFLIKIIFRVNFWLFYIPRKIPELSLDGKFKLKIENENFS